METTYYLVNQSSPSTLIDKTLHEVWTGKKPFIRHLKFFGCDAYVHVPKEKMSKLDNKVEKCIFIGYKYGMKCYNPWNHVTKTIFYNRHI